MLIVKYRLKNFVGSKSQAHSYILLWAGPNQSSAVKTDFFFFSSHHCNFPPQLPAPSASFRWKQGEMTFSPTAVDHNWQQASDWAWIYRKGWYLSTAKHPRLTVHMALSKTWLSLKHLLSHILHSHSSARLQAHTEALRGWREAASSVKHPGKQKECSTLLLPSRELISLHMSHFTYSKKWKHATTPSKWSQSTLQGICFHFKGRDQNPQSGEGGGGKKGKKERKKDAPNLCMRSMLGPASEVFTEEGRDMDWRIIEHFQCWIIYVLGVWSYTK